MQDFWTAVGAIFTGVAALATMVAIFVALFQDKLRRRFFCERLILEWDEAPPCIQWSHTVLRESSSPLHCYSVRIRVRNVGNASAESVQVMCEEMALENFAPVNFRWTQRETLTLERIAPGGGTACFDLGYIIALQKEGPKMMLAASRELNTPPILVPPGKYSGLFTISSTGGVNFRGQIRFEFTLHPQPMPPGKMLEPSVKVSIDPYPTVCGLTTDCNCTGC